MATFAKKNGDLKFFSKREETEAELRHKNGSSFADEKSSSSTRMLVIVFVSLVVDLLAFTVILPLLPALLEHYGKDRKVESIDYDTVLYPSL